MFLSLLNSEIIFAREYNYNPSSAERAAVRDAQHILNYLGFNAGTEDGIYGNATRNACYRAQHYFGLTQDGQFGNMTFNACVSYIRSINNVSSSKYSWQDAYNYAKTYWDKKNPNYRYYPRNNCANFVSQCLVAAGIPTDSNWYDGSYAFVNVVGLKNYFCNKYGVKYYSWPSASMISAGDVVYTSSGHVMICMGKTSDGRVIASGNTNNRDCLVITSLYGVLKTSALF